MTANSKQKKTKKSRPIWVGPLTALAVIIAVVAVVRWWQTGSPGEKDEPGILRNLTTMMGKMAPAFSLADSEGRTFTVAPGDGKNHVLIFHMGSI